MRKICSCDQEKLLKFEAEGREFEITRTIYSNSKRSEQFLKQNVFLTCSWIFLRSRTIIIEIGKKNWNFETYRKS